METSKRPKSHPSFAALKWQSQVGWLDTKMSCVTYTTQRKIDSAKRRQPKQMAEKLCVDENDDFLVLFYKVNGAYIIRITEDKKRLFQAMYLLTKPF